MKEPIGPETPPLYSSGKGGTQDATPNMVHDDKTAEVLLPAAQEDKINTLRPKDGEEQEGMLENIDEDKIKAAELEDEYEITKKRYDEFLGKMNPCR